MSDMLIFFVYPNGKKEQFIPNNLKELYVFNAKEEFRKYLTLVDEVLTTSYGMLFRVIVDGKCKLISSRIKDVKVHETVTNSGNSNLNANGISVSIPNYSTSIDANQNYESQSFQIFYNNKFWACNSFFKTKNKEAFSDCPELIEQVENKTFRSNDFHEMTEEFNRCIAGENFEQKKN